MKCSAQRFVLQLTEESLNRLSERKGEQGTLFGDLLSEYPDNVASLCLQAIRQLGLDSFLSSLGWSEEKVQVSLTHLITRTVYTPSELKSMRIIQENSAVADIVGIDRDRLKKHNIYSVAPSLYDIKDKLDTYLFDLTNFYFESPKRSSDKAKFGRSDI